MELVGAGRGRTPIVAGVVTSLVGFTSSSAIVLAGLRGVGATQAEAASGLVAVCVTQALGILWLSRRHRMPITLAWSTPGAAVLASTGVVHGGWQAAVGAFLLVGGLIVLTGAWAALGALVAAIPVPVAQAMLAGVVFELCLAPVRGATEHPWSIGVIVLAWLVLLKCAPRWAVPGAFVATLTVVGVDVIRAGGVGVLSGGIAPAFVLTMPTLSWAAVVSIAVPLYIVTMAGQNVPGAAVLSSYGYRVPWRESMTVTGVGTLIGATAGGYTINLAAITAALAASPDSDPDPQRRWIASWTAGWCYLVLALVSTAVTTFLGAAPAVVVAAVAGIALVGTLGSSLAAALADTGARIPAAVAFVVAASGVSVHGIGAAFFALVAGLIAYAVTREGTVRRR